MMELDLLIIACVFTVAVLYSSVGHGGASGYLAVMALFAVEQSIVRPTALILNLFVSSIAAFQFYRAGFFDFRIFLQFAAGSVPLAFVGGMIHLPSNAYKIVLGFVLIVAAARLAWNFTNDREPSPPRWGPAVMAGAAIGLLSGLVGVGGGIFLTPVLLLMNWTDTRRAAGISALFIFVNSLSGLAGSRDQVVTLQPMVYGWVGVAVAGGLLGSTLGSTKLGSLTLRRVLALVLVFAGLKLILT